MPSNKIAERLFFSAMWPLFSQRPYRSVFYCKAIVSMYRGNKRLAGATGGRWLRSRARLASVSRHPTALAAHILHAASAMQNGLLVGHIVYGHFSGGGPRAPLPCRHLPPFCRPQASRCSVWGPGGKTPALAIPACGSGWMLRSFQPRGGAARLKTVLLLYLDTKKAPCENKVPDTHNVIPSEMSWISLSLPVKAASSSL